MTIDELKRSIVSVANTLNGVEVRGRDNLNHLLGCIMVLEKLAGNIDKLEVPEVTGVEVEHAACEAE